MHSRKTPRDLRPFSCETDMVANGPTGLRCLASGQAKTGWNCGHAGPMTELWPTAWWSPIRLHQALKNGLRRSGLTDVVLHVHIGLAIWWVLACAIGDAGSPFAVAGLCVAECLNEAMDRLRKGAWYWRETLPDFLHTMAWPTLICISIHSGFI
eukprot:gene11230-11314_t